MKNIYYKIGEFSKLTGVSIKSLRYYDEIGALKPAYINKETGYRFYVPEQIIQLDIIKLCLLFDIPLKNVNIKGNKKIPDFKSLILYGRDKAREQLRETMRILRLSEDLLFQVERLEQKRKDEEEYHYFFDKRNILISKWNWKEDTDEMYLKKISDLRKKAVDNNLTLLTQQGLFLDAEHKDVYVFVSFEGDYTGEDSLSFESKEYTCMTMEENKLESIQEILKKKNMNIAHAFCLNTDIYDFCLKHPLHKMELQFLEV